jgi:hypothetical protein
MFVCTCFPQSKPSSEDILEGTNAFTFLFILNGDKIFTEIKYFFTLVWAG